MDNIVIFGGSFDPVHCGHLAIIEAAFQSIDIKQLLIFPTGLHPEGKKYFFSNEERLMMVQEAIKLLPHVNKKIQIRDDELYNQYQSYTINTIKNLYQEFLNAQFHLLIGMDQAIHFDSWYQAEELKNLVTLWVFPRKNEYPIKGIKGMIGNLLNCSLQNISSSEIRDLLIKKDRDALEHNPYIIPFVKKYIKSYIKN